MQGEKLQKGPWHEEEDKQLITFVRLLGERRWDHIAKVSGIKRSGKSCRLRWLNYLRPNIKHGDISAEEEHIICQLHEKWGNKWARIARSLPGRTDNEIKNYWKSRLKKKMQAEEQENIQQGKRKQDLSFQKVDLDVRTNMADNHNNPIEDISETGNSSSDALDFGSSAVTTSPYEARFFDWLSELSNDQSNISNQQDFNCTESSICYTRISEESDIWGWSGSIWDMN